MTSILQQQAAALGMTYGAYLRQLAESGEPIATMAARIGINSSRIYYEWHRYGLKKRRSKDFEFLGVVDSIKGHCEALDLNINIARMRIFHRKAAPVDVIREMLAEQQEREINRLRVAA